jgi:hypothetical protein
MKIYGDLKTQPTKIWRCVSCFKQHTSYAIHLDVNGIGAVEPVRIAKASAEHLHSAQFTIAISLVYCPVIFCSYLLFHN